MRCTDCSQPVRPIVSVDIDGTLGDYHGHFIKFAEQYLGMRVPFSYGGGSEFSEFLGLEKHVYREVKLAYRQGGQKRSMNPYRGAPQFMRDLREDGFEVWIATTRPWQRLDNIDPDTRFWLDRHEIPYDGMVYGDDKYAQLFDRVEQDRAVLVIDDLLEMCQAASAMGLYVMQPMRMHNINERWPNTFAEFSDALKVAHTLKHRWEVKHGA